MQSTYTNDMSDPAGNVETLYAGRVVYISLYAVIRQGLRSGRLVRCR